jgi:hypothetical protein
VPMSAPYSLLCVESRRVRGADAFTAGSAYAALFLLGLVEGIIGCFQFSRSIGPVPVAALAFCAVIFLTCLLAAWGMGSPLGGLVPALGWFAASLVLSLPAAGGSVIVTNTAAGKWFLYGGAVSAGLGMVLSLRGRFRR